MSADQPTLAVQVALNLEKLKTDIAAGKTEIESFSPSVAALVEKWQTGGASLVQNAANIVAAIDKIGVSTLTISQSAQSLKTLDAAIEHMQATGLTVPPTMQEIADKLRVVGSPESTSGVSALTVMFGTLLRDAAM